MVPLAQRIARWTSNPKVLGSIPRWDEAILILLIAGLKRKKTGLHVKCDNSGLTLAFLSN